ncbi:biogenesis of lysosome-related organelles complex 1 subunit 4 isoform X2 [Rhinatrema bivittatum]|uniref:biogenesis of lysosome-related organelles complex 1 subunit 4 isoform X2 n=1 Tax=Rhinatrema bivittatum TaxID=194408 RepID=UPI0011293FF9|nr:biogenesis of lysosome-related organelles complex 1 subunit 4 isoform X2 [Rhinatrema bivittatum]
MEGSRRSEAGGKPLQKNGEEGEPEPQSSGRDSGNVSQSHSSASGVGEEDGKEPGAATLEPLLSQAAAEYCSYLLPGGFSPEIETLDKSLEDLLTRVDEFVGMLDMIRNDSSQVVNESVPQIHTKAAEMKTIYKKIDMLEQNGEIICPLISDTWIPRFSSGLSGEIINFVLYKRKKLNSDILQLEKK